LSEVCALLSFGADLCSIMTCLKSDLAKDHNIRNVANMLPVEFGKGFVGTRGRIKIVYVRIVEESV
jgi:hypothetical protein